MSQVQKAHTPFQSIGDQTLLRHGCPENEFSLFLLQLSTREFIFYLSENLFYHIACSESDSMRVSVDVWLEFFNSLVCGIGTKHLGKEIISERENCCI